eukprot:17025-Heterococcus_DN1.PRE.2
MGKRQKDKARRRLAAGAECKQEPYRAAGGALSVMAEVLLAKKLFASTRGDDLATAVEAGVRTCEQHIGSSLTTNIVLRGDHVMSDLAGAIVTDEPVNVYCSTGTNFQEQLQQLQKQITSTVAVADEDRRRMNHISGDLEGTKLKLEHTRLELASVKGVARALAVAKCNSLANRILLCASKGGEDMQDSAEREEKEDVWKRQLTSLWKRKQVSQRMNLTVLDFVNKSISINRTRNSEAHPDAAHLSAQVASAKAEYLTLSKVRSKCKFAAAVIDNFEHLVLDA